MYSTSKGKLGGNLLAIKNYIEKNGLDFKIKVVTALNPIPQNELAAEMAQSKFILVDDYERWCMYCACVRGRNLYRYGTQWVLLNASATAETALRKVP